MHSVGGRVDALVQVSCLKPIPFPIFSSPTHGARQSRRCRPILRLGCPRSRPREKPRLRSSPALRFSPCPRLRLSNWAHPVSTTRCSSLPIHQGRASTGARSAGWEMPSAGDRLRQQPDGASVQTSQVREPILAKAQGPMLAFSLRVSLWRPGHTRLHIGSGSSLPGCLPGGRWLA